MIAPQEFKGSLGADEAAAAIASGIRSARPDWQLDILPMSDGGPGLLDAMRRAVNADTMAAVVRDALGRDVLGRYIRLRSTGEVIIEAAQANGLFHLLPDERDAVRADSYGVGQLIADAAASGPRRIIIGVGGSATTDGGAGALRALGARFFDMAGNELPPGGGALANLEHIAWTPPAWLSETSVVVATDVTNPLCGPNGAARVYAPQKGAPEAEVAELEAALFRFAQVVRRHFGIDAANLPGGGAAGGLALGLAAFLGAPIRSGFEMVAEAVGLPRRVEAAEVVVTGEGSFDAQSVQGKVTGRIIAMAQARGKPVVVFAGRSREPGVMTLGSLASSEADSMDRAAELLARAAREWATAV